MLHLSLIFLTLGSTLKSWEHEARERYRSKVWHNLVRDRPQHFSGAYGGINKTLSTNLLAKLVAEADIIQQKLDLQEIPDIDPKIDPRPQIKILRLLLTAGLQNPDSNHRHRRQQGEVQCLCKQAAPTLWHISWECIRYGHLRKAALDNLPRPIKRLPVCFQMTTLVPHSMKISIISLERIQLALIKVWQAHIQDHYESIETHQIVTPVDPRPQQELSTPSQPVARNGHVVQFIPTGGVFCVKCGKQTKNTKHLKLKILRKPCAFPHIRQSEWLNAPGASQSKHRVQAAETQLYEKYNSGQHSPIWNRKFGKQRGKEDFGLIWCSACGRSWPWMDRHNDSTTLCRPASPAPTPPSWVINLPHFSANRDQGPVAPDSDATLISSVISPPVPRLVPKPTPKHIPKKRLTNKISPNSFPTLFVSPISSPGEIASGSGDPIRRGVG